MQINVETFEAALRARGIKQADLARKARLGAKTVGRIRRGEDLRRSNVEKIAAALDMPVEALLEPPSADLSERAAKKSGMQRFVIDLPTETLNQLWFVKANYRVSVRALIEWAPLLFTIVAEKSLAERRKKLDEWFEAAKEAISNAPDRYNDEVGALQSDIEDLYWIERESIDSRDLAGGYTKEHTTEEGGGNPFLSFVEGLATNGVSALDDDWSELFFYGATIEDISYFIYDHSWSNFSGHTLLVDSLRDDHGGMALSALEDKDVLLRDIPEELLSEERRQERVRWLASFYGGAKGDFELALARWHARVASPDVDSTETYGGDDEQASA
jgi:hypothetical protein